MIIFFQKVIALLPVLVLCITVLFVLLFIVLRRNHCTTFFITIFGFTLSFFSLYLVWKNGIQDVTNLIRIDGFSILCMMLVLVSGFLSSLISRVWLSHCCSSDNYCDEFYLLLLVMNIGSMVVINASHVVTLFFGIELISLPLFGLMGYFNKREHSLEATIKYVLLSGISTSFLLFGISLVYVETTCLSFFDIYWELIKRPDLNHSMVLMGGIVMMLVGFGFKLSLVPFHLWTADVYQGAPELAGLCLATISKISIFSALTRFFLLFPENYNKISYILILISCFSILFGNVMAVKQNNMKRILAYSSVAHMGYLLVAVSATMQNSSEDCRYILNLLTDGIEAISIGLASYLLATLSIFSILCLLFCWSYNKSEDIGSLVLYRGLFWRDPILSIIFTIIILTLSGMPLTLGFISKFYLIVLSVKNELLWCAVFIIFGTVVSMLYYLRIITMFYLSPLFERTRFLGIFPYKMNGSCRLLTVSSENCGDRLVLRLSGCIIIIFSVLLLLWGIYPRLLMSLFFLIQQSF